MRRFFKWFGIGVASLLGLIFAVAFWLIGGPQEIRGKLFPKQYYDNVEVKLIIDGEQVTIRGTAFCSISHRSMPIIGYQGSTTTRNGGAAVSVMSDGRAIVIPYSDREYCRGLLAADGFPDPGYKDWSTVFDHRFSLKGNIDILIMDDGNNPTSAEVILGPEYFRNPDVSIKLISADRWRSERGEETTSGLDWFSSAATTKYSRAWVGAYVAVLEAEFYEAEPKFLPFVEYLREYGDDDDPPAAPKGRWREAAFAQPGVFTRAVSVNGVNVTLERANEPFRIPMKPRSAFPTRRELGRQPLVEFGSCSGPSEIRGWFSIGEVTFRSGERELDVGPIGFPKDRPRSSFFDRETRDLIFGSAVCVQPH